MKVTIDANEYARLLRSEYKLDVLEADGVDNWEWYGEGFDDFYWEIMDDYTVEEVIKTLGTNYDQKEEGPWIDIIETIKTADTGHWEDDIWSLEDHGYSVKELDEEVVSTGRWTETVKHVYRFKKGLMVYTLGIEVESGRTENQEDPGIVDIYEVFPIPVETISWEKK